MLRAMTTSPTMRKIIGMNSNFTLPLFFYSLKSSSLSLEMHAWSAALSRRAFYLILEGHPRSADDGNHKNITNNLTVFRIP